MNDNAFDDFHKAQNRRRKKIHYRPKMYKRNMRKRDKITIYDYLAQRVPADASFTINKFGRYRRARNSRELAGQLKDFIRTFGEKGLNELAKIHPDKKLLGMNCEGCRLSANKRNYKDEQMQMFIQQQKMFNATGGGNKEVDKKNVDEGSKTLMYSGFLLLALAIVLKK